MLYTHVDYSRSQLVLNGRFPWSLSAAIQADIPFHHLSQFVSQFSCSSSLTCPTANFTLINLSLNKLGNDREKNMEVWNAASDLWLTISLSVLACWCAHGKYAQKLLNDLFTNYTSALRPVEDTNKILNVTLQVTLSQIIDMVKNNIMCSRCVQMCTCVQRPAHYICIILH